MAKVQTHENMQHVSSGGCKNLKVLQLVTNSFVETRWKYILVSK